MKRKKSGNMLFATVFLVLLFAGILYIQIVWDHAYQSMVSQARQMAEGAQSMMPSSYLKTLDGDETDLLKIEYTEVKNGLSALVEKENEIVFAYVYKKSGDKLYILADSEKADSSDYSPPGQEYTEAESILFTPFVQKRTVIAQEISDRWGEWDSILVPVIDHETGEVICVLRLDYYAGIWRKEALTQTLLSVAVVMSLMAAYAGLWMYYTINRKLIWEEKKLRISEQRILRSEKSKDVLLSNLPGVAYRCNYDREWTMHYISEGCFELTGYHPDELIDNSLKSFNDLIHPAYRQYLWDLWPQALLQNTRIQAEYEIMTKNGEIKWVYEQGVGIRNEDGEIEALEGLLIDITQRKQYELELKYRNEHSSVSGLYNRRFFEETITRELSRNFDRKRAVLLIRLGQFNMVYLTLGYQFGEELMKDISIKLTELCTEDIILFDISFDSLVFYVREYRDEKSLITLAEEITSVLNTAHSSGVLGTTIGIYEITGEKSYDEILKNATLAAEHVDDNFTRRYRFFDKEMSDKLMREVMIQYALADYLANTDDGRMFMHYQPILKAGTDHIAGFEALARFEDKGIGQITPGEFIPIAEESRQIIMLGKRIMQQVFIFTNEIARLGFHDLRISFNVSVLQILRDDFIETISKILDDTDVSPQMLVMELTESVFLNNYNEINKKLEEIRKLGIGISIDDFGTGYSSLSRIRELNIDYIKIDKYFVDMLNEEAGYDISEDIISMAHKLGYHVVAEGIENRNQEKHLIERECDYFQGFLFGRPLSEKNAVQLLNYQRIQE